MAAKRYNGDNEAGLRRKLESVLDSDCEYNELSDAETESEECVSSSDSSSSASSDESLYKCSKEIFPVLNTMYLIKIEVALDKQILHLFNNLIYYLSPENLHYYLLHIERMYCKM
ncbi:hypothetical protein C0J52_25924 [Blattella germanica]|nr:hypothetical protein C0J52_25924 [Blattella germanica]